MTNIDIDDNYIPSTREKHQDAVLDRTALGWGTHGSCPCCKEGWARRPSDYSHSEQRNPITRKAKAAAHAPTV